MMTLARLAMAGVVALGAALASTPALLAAEYTVVLENMKFGPVPAELHVGDTIIWQNNDIFRHSATARDKSFDVDLPPQSEARMAVGKPGTVVFYCKFHPGMTGTLVISP